MAVGTVGGGGVFVTILEAELDENEAKKFRMGSIYPGSVNGIKRVVARMRAVNGFILNENIV